MTNATGTNQICGWKPELLNIFFCNVLKRHSEQYKRVQLLTQFLCASQAQNERGLVMLLLLCGQHLYRHANR